MSDQAIETVKAPMQPWQYIAVVSAVILAICVLWFFLRGDISWHHEAAKKLERADIATPPPVFVGIPDAKETAAHQAATSAGTGFATVVDESAEFNAPITATAAQAMPFSSQGSNSRAAADPSIAMATPGAGGGSLFGATAAAYHVPHPMYTIRKGTLIPCEDVTAIDTGTGGNVGITATVHSDVWGMGHHMILLPKGTTVVGEIGHGLVNGLDRLAVAWREFTTPEPDNIGVEISSPAVGPLGEGGLEGDVKRHEWQKIKGVLGLSLLQGGLSIGQALASRGSTNISFGPIQSGGNEIGNTLLQSTINIPDTIHRDQGLACGIYLAQDIDFSRVYSAKVKTQ